MKVSLYTITFSGMYYVGPHVPLRDLIPRTKALGYDGIEIEGKRPFGFPPDLEKKAREEIKELAKSEGIEISAIAAYNNFASPVMEEIENELLMVREQIRLAYDLEAPLVRVFTAWKGVTLLDAGTSPSARWVTYDFSRDRWNYPTTEIDKWRRVRNGLKECTKWAEEFGVNLALQNHVPVVRPGYEDTLQMIREVRSDYLKMCLDVPLFTQEQQSKEYIHEAVQACHDLIIHSHFGGNFIEVSDGRIVQLPFQGGVYSEHSWKETNYATFISELKKIDYNGHISYELCSPLVIDHEPAGIEEVDRRAKLASEYMRKLISQN